MRVFEIATGLWRWTGRHPAWTPADGGPEGWDQEVGCYLYEGPRELVLFDPLVPMEDPTAFAEALDRDVKRSSLPLRILLTAEAHRRSSREIAHRYGAAVGGPASGVETAAEPVGEQVFWIAQHRALVVGDVLVGRAGGLRVPRSWLEDRYDGAVAALYPLLDLPVERVLVTHGEPVLSEARAALEAALCRDG